MKSIKIRPLTLVDDLEIVVKYRQDIEISDSANFKKILEMASTFAIQNKKSGIILAKTLDEQPAAVTTNVQTKDGQTFQFPEPNPVHLYFQNSCNHLLASKTLLGELKAICESDVQKQYDKFLDYFNEVTCGITFLVISIESFINQQIPDDFSYKGEASRSMQWSKKDVERKDLKTKIKIILPKIGHSNFAETNKRDYDQIMQVQDFRDELVHLKPEHKDNKTYYEDIIKRLLDFEPDKYVDAAFSFINSIRPEYLIEENLN